ncbi:GH11005 [Drosophila grimshawi]|uniref:GH11005 n=1 Tax=Drosophila grimshawi TaxID=7222 RepID=B4JBS0_DROGR|nr:GH11005 [Drosophila grimshawi]
MRTQTVILSFALLALLVAYLPSGEAVTCADDPTDVDCVDCTLAANVDDPECVAEEEEDTTTEDTTVEVTTVADDDSTDDDDVDYPFIGCRRRWGRGRGRGGRFRRGGRGRRGGLFGFGRRGRRGARRGLFGFGRRIFGRRGGFGGRRGGRRGRF